MRFTLLLLSLLVINIGCELNSMNKSEQNELNRQNDTLIKETEKTSKSFQNDEVIDSAMVITANRYKGKSDTIWVNLNPKNVSNLESGYVVISGSTPSYMSSYFLPGQDLSSSELVEFLDKKGLPYIFLIKEEGNTYYKYEYSYKNDKILTIKKSDFYGVHNSSKEEESKMNYKFIFNTLNDTVVDNFLEDKLLNKIFSIIITEKFQIKEFISKTRNVWIGDLQKYDRYGRLISSVRLFEESFLDYKITFEKYIYDSDNTIWESRTVESMEFLFDPEDIRMDIEKYDNLSFYEFLQETNSIDKAFDVKGFLENSQKPEEVTFYDFLKKKVLVFPKDFDQKKKVFNETRIVKKL